MGDCMTNIHSGCCCATDAVVLRILCALAAVLCSDEHAILMGAMECPPFGAVCSMCAPYPGMLIIRRSHADLEFVRLSLYDFPPTRRIAAVSLSACLSHQTIWYSTQVRSTSLGDMTGLTLLAGVLPGSRAFGRVTAVMFKTLPSSRLCLFICHRYNHLVLVLVLWFVARPHASPASRVYEPPLQRMGEPRVLKLPGPTLEGCGVVGRRSS